jgi:hypothetical protein
MPPRPSHPALDVRDDRDAPSCERGTDSLNHNFRLSEMKIFLREGLASSGKTGGAFAVLPVVLKGQHQRLSTR